MIKIKKLGTCDIFIVEANPIVFKNKLYRFEYIRFDCGQAHRCYRHNHTGDSYFRFVEVKTGRVLPGFGRGLHMGNAFVWNDRIYVTAVEGWGKKRFYQIESDDLEHWTSPRIILENLTWEGYNTTMCCDNNGFLLAFELGAPLDIVGEPFTMFFARSTDLKNWEVLEDAVFGRDIYTGGPMLRYFAGWYYFFFLDGSYEKNFLQSVARSQKVHVPLR